MPITAPRGRFLTGHFRDFRRDPLGFLAHTAQAHGDVVPLRFVNRRALLLSHPAAIHDVLLTHHRSFRKHLALRQLARPALGEGLLLAEGAAWQRQRQVSQPAFRPERIARYASIMVEEAWAQAARWRDGEVHDLHAELMTVTARIVTRCLLGSDLGGFENRSQQAIDHLSVAFKARMDAALRLPLWIPTPANRRFLHGMRRMDAVLQPLISARRTGPPQEDLLGALLAAQDADGRPAFDDQQLRDQVATLFFAGHETTANAMTFTHHLLARHPAVRERVEAEIQEVCGARRPTVEDVPRLVWCGRVLDEALRIMPPVWVLGREAVEPVDIAGYRVARGTTVLVSPWVVHRDARWFEDPLAFRPERWADGLERRLPGGTYFPFGGGPRVCIGQHFARVEMVLLLACQLAQVRCETIPGEALHLMPSLTLRPRDGVRMRLHRRAAAQGSAALGARA